MFDSDSGSIISIFVIRSILHINQSLFLQQEAVEMPSLLSNQQREHNINAVKLARVAYMDAHMEIHVVISLATKAIYLPRIDPDLGRLLIVCAFGNQESRTESVSREKRGKNQLPNQVRVIIQDY